MDCQSLSILRKDKTEISHIILGVQAKILGAQSNFQIKDNNIEKIETTLAQLVYNDQRVLDQFDIKAWVYVSQDFDVVSVTKAMLTTLRSLAALASYLFHSMTQIDKFVQI